MNIYTATLVEIYIEDGTTMGKVSVNGALTNILMTLILDARVGDRVLVESGMGISVLHNDDGKDTGHVLGYSGESRRN